jgi:hypothetical protein
VGEGHPVCRGLDGGDLTALRAECGRDATVNWHTVKPHGAGAAIACVATLLDTVPSEGTHEGPQTPVRDAVRRRTCCR